jgi:hypothetical protein
VQCPVQVVGILQSSSEDYSDLVQALEFNEFDALHEYMESCKDRIEQCNEVTLNELHERFVGVVESVIGERGLYSSEFPAGAQPRVERYAAPNVRGAGAAFAPYLHNDAWYTTGTDAVGLVNIWFVLNEQPPSNQLVFHRTSAAEVLQTHMLHGVFDSVHGKTVVFDEQMSWGRFYCFVSGQVACSERERVLLHGAMDIPPAVAQQAAGDGNKRRSCEMRYTLHARGSEARAERNPTAAGAERGGDGAGSSSSGEEGMRGLFSIGCESSDCESDT